MSGTDAGDQHRHARPGAAVPAAAGAPARVPAGAPPDTADPAGGGEDRRRLRRLRRRRAARRRSPPDDALPRGDRARTASSGSGCYEPTEAELDVDRRAVRAAPARGRGRRRTPTSGRSSSSYDDALFMVLKTARYVEHEQLTATSEVVDTGEVMVFLGAHYVITVRHGEHGGLKELRQPPRGAARPAVPRARRRCSTPSPTWWSTTSSRSPTAVEEDVDELEASVFSPDRTDDIGRLYQLKRELMQLRRAVSPLEVPLQKLAERQIDVVPDGDALLLPRRPGPRDPGARPGRRRWTSC